MGKLTNEEYKKLKELVFNFKTKHEEGFLPNEQKELLSRFPSVDENKYSEAIGVVTCMMDEETKEFIIYHDDVFTGLLCALEDRDKTVWEWD